MIKWDVRHRLELGVSPEQAIGETLEYRNYIFDRLRAITALGVPIPSFSEIRLEEEVGGRPTVPVFFFHREYVPGTATDKIVPARYGRPGFLPRLTRFLGRGGGVEPGARSRLSARRRPYFDDGDEMVQFNAAGLPERLYIAETHRLLRRLDHAARRKATAVSGQGAPASGAGAGAGPTGVGDRRRGGGVRGRVGRRDRTHAALAA